MEDRTRHVDGVGESGVRITKEPLHGELPVQSAAARPREDLVDRPHRPPGSSGLGAPPDGPLVERDLFARLGFVVETIHRLEQSGPRRRDLGGRLADGIEDVRILLDLLAGDGHSVSLRRNVTRQRTLGDTDHRRRDAKREHTTERHQVGRLGATGRPRRTTVHHVCRVEGPVGRDEGAVDHHILRAGTTQAHHIPRVIDDGVVGTGQEDVQDGRRHDRLAVCVAHDRP